MNFEKLIDISHQINSFKPLKELLPAIIDAAKDIVQAEGASLLLNDQETDELIFNIVLGEKGNIIEGERLPRGAGIAGRVAVTGEPLVVNDPQNDDRFYKEIDRKSSFITRNIIAMPMRVMNQLVGVLEIVNAIDRDGFDNDDLIRARFIADHAAIAIANRQLNNDLSNRVLELTTLYDLSQAISFREWNVNIYQDILDALAQQMQVSRASIILHDPELTCLKIVASYGHSDDTQDLNELQLSIEGSIAGHVFTNRDPMLVTNIQKELPPHLVKDHYVYQTDSFISVPAVYRGEPVGVISLADKLNGTVFDSFDLRVLTTISSQVAELHNNIRNQQQEVLQQKIAQEIDIASEIQKKVLPSIPSRHKDHLMAAFTKPSRNIGGDFYDYFPFDENKYAILVGDISGKGIPAALFMGTARNVLRAERRFSPSPAQMLGNAEHQLYEESEFGMFVTIFYALIDVHNHIITYGSAGHNHQLLLRNDGTVERLKAHGVPLGISDGTSFEERVLTYNSGDTLLLFTDGITEALGGDELDIDRGEEKLAELAQSLDTPADIIHHITNLLESQEDGDDRRDDVTIFAVQF